MGSLGDKIMNFFGFEMEDVEDDPFVAEEDNNVASLRTRTVRNNVVNIHSNQNVRIVVVSATKFDQVQDFASELKNRRPVLINLEHVDRETGRRILDFMAGSTYAVGGLMRKVSSKIFLFAPSNIDIDGNIPGDDLEKEFVTS